MSQVTITTIDGFPLAATWFEPPSGTPTRAVVVFGCATGVHARFYNDFAAWLATQGVAALTFDYRYQGLSFPPPYDAKSFTQEERDAAMKSCPEDITLTETWGKKDFPAAVRFASDAKPGVPLTIVSNSLGGHLMTLSPEEWPRITRFLSIGGGNAYWGNTRTPKEARFLIQGAVKTELEETRLFPAEMMGLGRSLPLGPGREWIEWSEHPHFALRKKEDADTVRRLTGKQYLYIGFEDDETLSKKIMLQQLGLYSHADRQKHTLWIDPAKQNPPWPPCKHVNSFMRTRPSTSTNLTQASNSSDTSTPLRREDTIWRVYLAYILSGDIDKTLGEYKCWAPEDERDLDAERAEHEKFVRREEREKARVGRLKRWWSGKAKKTRATAKL